MKARLLPLLVFLCGFSMVLNGCSAVKENAINATAYTYTVAFNDIVYGITDREVSVEKIDHFIGETNFVVSPKVTQNNQMGCSVSECKAPPGTKFYAIKDLNFNDTIAIEVPNGTNSLKYYKCISFGKLAGAAQKLYVKAIYFVAETGGVIAPADLEKHSEINVVHQFADLMAASKAGIAILD